MPGMQSVLTFCEIHPPDDFPLYIYRNPTAPDMYVDTGDLPLDQIASAPIFWATATGLSRSPAALHTMRPGTRGGVGSTPCWIWTTGRCSGTTNATLTVRSMKHSTV